MIIKSLFDNDFYNFTMADYIIASNMHETPVRFEFKNRTGVRLGMEVDLGRLREELDNLRFIIKATSILEIDTLLEIMSPQSALYFRDVRINPPEIEVDVDLDGHLQIGYEGKWIDCIFYETPILAIVNQLWAEGQERMPIYAYRNLLDKIECVVTNDLKFMEFGTRRRYSADWQDRVVEILKESCPNQLVGTSNVFLAKKYDIPFMGTMAHQLFMVAAAVMGGPNQATMATLFNWTSFYGSQPNRLVALTDTFGTDMFLDLFRSHAQQWSGVRQDSGDPFKFGEKIWTFYTDNGIDPKTKTIVFSDGLDVDKMNDLNSRFRDRFGRVIFGWGTNLTNDVGVKPLSIVVKPVKAADNWCVKLSDNVDKATGNPEEILKYMDLAGYRANYSEKPLY